ncbi:MAG TPA: hypothetical protein VLF90_02320 [Patescibacteria group bacterium]|nr:hypothetical protein [Patescibacteria group bacterium]
MAEHEPIIHSPEHHEHEHSAEHLPKHEQAESQPKHEKAETKPLEDVETLRAKAEHEAKSSKETTPKVTPETDVKQDFMVNKDLKAEAFQRALNRTRKHLSSPERGLSKAIHQPVVDAISGVAEKTIARPTGLLTGAIVALIGSSYVFYSAKHYGWHYNYLIVFILFVGGYVVGLILEIIWFALRHLRPAK